MELFERQSKISNQNILMANMYTFAILYQFQLPCWNYNQAEFILGFHSKLGTHLTTLDFCLPFVQPPFILFTYHNIWFTTSGSQEARRFDKTEMSACEDGCKRGTMLDLL